MSVYLYAAGQSIIVEFPFNTVREIESAAREWMENRRVISWRYGDGDEMVLLVNYGMVGELLVTTSAPEPDESGEPDLRPTVRAMVEHSSETWDPRELGAGGR